MQQSDAMRYAMMQSAGTVPAVEEFRLVILYDRETGVIINRSSTTVFAGGKASSDETAVAEALARIEAYNRRFDQLADLPESQMRLKRVTPEQLGAVVTRDPAHMEGAWEVDARSGTLVPGKDRDRGAAAP